MSGLDTLLEREDGPKRRYVLHWAKTAVRFPDRVQADCKTGLEEWKSADGVVSGHHIDMVHSLTALIPPRVIHDSMKLSSNWV